MNAYLALDPATLPRVDTSESNLRVRLDISA